MDNNQQPLCQDHDPEWWSLDHDTCAKGCEHRLAAHICTHCPFMATCQDEVMANPQLWGGMIMGGLVAVRRSNRSIRNFDSYKIKVMPESGRCEICTPSRQLAPVG